MLPHGSPKAYVERDFLGDRVKIHLAAATGNGSLWVLQSDGTIREVQPHETATDESTRHPYLQLPDELARELLDALAAHYGGTAEARQLRKDLDHERGRVDKLIAHLMERARCPASR